MDDLVADFLTETHESLAELDVALVTLERTPDDSTTLALIFRLVQTIKGTCGFLGLPRLEQVAHAAESVLGKLRDGSLVVTPAIISQILAAIDCIKLIIAGLGDTGEEPPGNDAVLIAALDAIATADPNPPDMDAPDMNAPDIQEPRSGLPPMDTPRVDVPDMAVPHMHASPPDTRHTSTPQTGAPIRDVDAPALSQPADTRPDIAAQLAAPPAAPSVAKPLPATAAAAEPRPTETTRTETTRTETTRTETTRIETTPAETTPTATTGLRAPKANTAAPTPTGPASPPVTGAGPSAPPPAPAPAPQTIRVGVDVLEDLMTLVSELVLTRNQLLQLARSQENAAFSVPLQRLSHITSDLQEGVMKTRMQPIGNAWNKLPRLVRDLAHDMHKKIDLTMLGADTELDRQVLELIKDPLTHMVRNSGDHGLETPAERRAAGKPETGHIVLNAFHEGGHIILEISDDGRGLAVDKITAKALANGLATEAEIAAMSDAQIQRFIFRPGFSTAASVSAVSGRGVGMDVVKTNIEKIGGTIELKSTPGQGTAFTVKIPLTLAIVSALIVEVANERFAIPQLSVIELVRVRTGEEAGKGDSRIERINDTPVLRLRNRLLPLVSLTDLLQLDANPSADGSAHVVVAQVGQQTIGIIVDRVFDTEEIVVKPVAPILRHVTMFSGNTILGDGSVIMILDPNGVARATGIGLGGESRLPRSSLIDSHSAAQRTAMLLFRAGDYKRMAVPLGLVARLENIPREQIETSSGAPVTQYRGKLMPLITIGRSSSQSDTHQPLLVFAEGERIMGLMVDEIIDVIEDSLTIELVSGRPGVLGTAVIGGQATDVLDTGYWLMQAWQDWFRGVPRKTVAHGHKQVLLVDDSDFFRQLMVPTLNAAGFDTTAVAGAEDALALRDAGAAFDAIIVDIDRPQIDMAGLAQALRAAGTWSAVPLIALSADADPQSDAAFRAAGFSACVAKMQRETLIATLRASVHDAVMA